MYGWSHAASFIFNVTSNTRGSCAISLLLYQPSAALDTFDKLVNDTPVQRGLGKHMNFGGVYVIVNMLVCYKVLRKLWIK